MIILYNNSCKNGLFFSCGWNPTSSKDFETPSFRPLAREASFNSSESCELHHRWGLFPNLYFLNFWSGVLNPNCPRHPYSRCSLSWSVTLGACVVGGAPTPGDQRSGRPPKGGQTFRQHRDGGGASGRASGLVSVFLRSRARLECRSGVSSLATCERARPIWSDVEPRFQEHQIGLYQALGPRRQLLDHHTFSCRRPQHPWVHEQSDRAQDPGIWLWGLIFYKWVTTLQI